MANPEPQNQKSNVAGSSTGIKTPSAQQIAGVVRARPFLNDVVIGSASGWVAGYMTGRFSKPFVLLAGTTLIVVHVAQHYGYLKDLNSLYRNTAMRNAPEYVNKVKGLANKNKTLAAGFAGGFLIGLGF